MSIHPTVVSPPGDSLDPARFAHEFWQHYRDFVAMRWHRKNAQWQFVAKSTFESPDNQYHYAVDDNIPKSTVLQMMYLIIEQVLSKQAAFANDPEAYMLAQRSRCANNKMVKDAVDMLGTVLPKPPASPTTDA